MENYNFFVYYSEEDEGFIEIIPDLPFLNAFDETPEEAVKELMLAKEGWIETAKMSDIVVPQPRFNPRGVFSELSALTRQIETYKTRIANLSSEVETLKQAFATVLDNLKNIRDTGGQLQDQLPQWQEEENTLAIGAWRH